MKTTIKNNKPSFSGTIISVILFLMIGLSSCKKESIAPAPTPTTPTTPVIDKNLVPDQPNIKYAGLHKLVAIGAAGAEASTAVDVNGDGTNDFTFAISKSSDMINIYMYANSRNSITTRPNFLLDVYSATAVINAEKAWNGASDMYRAGITTSGTFSGITKLPEETELYIGIKLLSNGTHYGWLRFKYQVFNGASSGALIEIIDSAYEQADGFAIEAGNTGL